MIIAHSISQLVGFQVALVVVNLQAGWCSGGVTLVTVSVANFRLAFSLQPLNCQILEKSLS